MSTRLGIVPATGMSAMVTAAIAVPSTTDPHATIESHGRVVLCAGQPEPSGVASCQSAPAASWVDVAFDATAELFVPDVERIELSIDIPL